MNAPNIKIETTDVPTTAGRPSEPNPFIPDEGNLFLSLAEGKAMTIRFDGTKDDNADAVKKLTAQARRAAQEATTDGNPDGLTARVNVTEETTGTGKNVKTQTVFTTWGRPRITRPRTQGTSQEAAASTANPNTSN